MLRFIYNLFFPTKPAKAEDDELLSCNVELLNDREELLSCKEEIITTHTYPKPTFQTESEILDLVKRFEDKTLPAHAWTHTAHLIVGAYYLKSYSWEEAKEKLRASIKAYNEAVGITNSPTSGYHETVTIFWLQYVRYLLNAFSGDFLQTCNLFSKGFINKDVLLRFYSLELIQSAEARQTWIEPDRKVLDFSKP